MYESLHYLLMTTHTSFQKSLLSQIKDTNLTPGQPKVLDYLKDHDGAIQKDIAAACHIEPASLTVILSGMEHKGFVERKTLDGNRRSLYVFLTESGRQLASRLEREFSLIETQALRGITKSEQKQLLMLLTKIYENIT